MEDIIIYLRKGLSIVYVLVYGCNEHGEVENDDEGG
jgi:hypothetical protein